MMVQVWGVIVSVGYDGVSVGCDGVSVGCDSECGV